MIVRDAEAVGGERAKILDFGIAKGQGATEAGEASVVKTQTGALMGTPRYMSPEQCRGLGEISGKSDVYSLGVMLYEMVSGRPPMVAESMGELIAMHLYMAPTPLRELDPTLSPDLTQLIHAMLAKSPDERPTMAEVMKQLEALGASRSIPPVALLTAGAVSHPDKTPPPASWPDSMAGMLATPTTLGGAEAQKSPAAKPASRRHVVPIVAAAVGSLAILVVVLVKGGQQPTAPAKSADRPAAAPGFATPPVPGQPAAPPVPAVAASKIHWRLSSQPSGAQVVRVRDGAMLGVTPWQTELNPGSETVELSLKLSGFADQKVVLTESADADRHEQLRPLPHAAASDSRGRGRRRGAQAGASSSKSASEDLSDDELRIVK